MKAYSQNLREKGVRACDEQRGTRAQIAHCFGVSTARIRRLLQRRRETGSFAAKSHGGGPPAKMTPAHDDRLVLLVREQPDATLEELRDRLGAPVHRSTIARALIRLRWAVKKKSSGLRNRTGPMSAGSGPAGGAGSAGSIQTGSS